MNLRALSGAEVEALREHMAQCKHLNLRLVRTNNCGLPFDCLDCGAKELPWTALNGLLAELNAVLRGK